jgi:ribonuclease HI
MAEEGVLTIHTDGASRGNPGAAAYAYTIEGGREIIEEAGCLGEMTNNQAEYTALVRALEHALELGTQHRVVVHSDSELMVKQLRGEYRVKNEELRPLYELAVKLAGRFTRPVTFRHVRREQNRRADELCNEALDGLRDSTRMINPAKRSSPPPAAGLDIEALACLRAAAAAWARGNPQEPSPEEVWRQLTALLHKHRKT